MKNKIKFFTILLTVVISALYVAPPAYAEQKPISVYLDGVQVKFDVTNGVQDQALTIYDYAYVPIARIIEILTGSRPEWDNYAKTSTYKYNGKTYVIDTAENGIYVDGIFIESVTGTPPVIANDRMMIPLKMLSSVMGFEQSYDAATHSTFLKTPVGITPVQTVSSASSKKSDEMWEILDNIEALVEEEIAVAARKGNVIELKERLGLSDEEIVTALLKYGGTSSDSSTNNDVSSEEAANFMRELREKEIASLAKEGNITELKERMGLSDEEIVAAVIKYGGTSVATTTNTAGVPTPKDFKITISRPNAGKKNDHIRLVFSWTNTAGVDGTRLSYNGSDANRYNDALSLDGNSRSVNLISVDTTANANKSSIDIVTGKDYTLCFYTEVNGKFVYGGEVRPTAIIDERSVTYDAKGTPISRTATIPTVTSAPNTDVTTDRAPITWVINGSSSPTPAPSTDVTTDRAPITWVINGSSSPTPNTNTTVQCWNCGGSGQQVCTGCGGSGMKRTYAGGQWHTISCAQCHGTTRENCSVCDGRGSIASADVPGNDNANSTGIKCTVCGGTGTWQCFDCNGSGVTMQYYVSSQDYGPATCLSCGGKKTLPCISCGGDGIINGR